MRNKFDEQLELLNNELIEMGALIERSIASAVKALCDKDTVLAKSVITYEDDIDRKESDIEALCMKLLLHQQPVASDLRLISAAMKMITDMERIGDQAEDIAEISIIVSSSVYVKKLVHITEMAKAVIGMVNDCIDAFVKRDLNIAKQVIEKDDDIDELFDIIKSELTSLIVKNPDISSAALDLLMVAKYLERIGDHAQNIAECVIYSITGARKTI